MTDPTYRVWDGSMPEVYDRFLGPVIFEPYARDLASRAAGPGVRDVLELAAGTGIVTRELLLALPDAAVTATDLNPAMVEYGAAHVPGATWRQADAGDLPFPDASADLVVCQFGIMFFPDKVLALREVRRVLRPGGRVILNSWGDVDHNDFARIFVESLAGLFPDDPPTFLSRVPHGFYDEAEIRDLVAAAGLGLVDLATVDLASDAESIADVTHGYCFGTPMRFEIEARGDLAATALSLTDAMTSHFGPGPVSGRMRARVVAARREAS